jgi:Ca-activated chloride channel family protein
MKRSHLISLLTFLLLLVGITSVAAQGIIVPCPPPPPCTVQPCPLTPTCIQPGVFTDPTWLKIDYHRVNVEIANQIATTNVDMQFTNQGEALAEGTFVFPLPEGASVDQLVMYVNGQAIEAKILGADEARGIYNEIVRQYRDPALLEYIGTSAIQANIFPIPPGESRRIEISYSQVLEVDNGLIKYVYPLNSAGTTARIIGTMSVSVHVASNDEISSIYSPSHSIAISRESGNKGFRTGFESSSFIPDGDFSLYYGIANEQINVNLLTYRESASEDGFFLLLVQPPVNVPAEQVVPKDVIIVLDQSGSMEGDKWTQAQEAAIYVLQHLNPNDHFNVVVFSTGWRIYSNELETVEQAQGAVDWIRALFPEGGTDINGALTTALDMAHVERPTTILFLTDGLATEGEIDPRNILSNLNNKAKSNVRIFNFGVGDDVDTFLLDAIVRDHRGTVSYVRTGERIDEEVASLYNKISAPVLNDIALDFGGMQVELLYPNQLPDLFAGEQLTLVGRFRGEVANTNITLSGKVNGQPQSFIYSNLAFPGRAGGEPFIARLWATRRIGDLLNNIRLNGENPELVKSVVDLSIRYGIITPYTSFLIDENDILTQSGRDRAAESFNEEAQILSGQTTGSGAVDAADTSANLAAAQAPLPMAAPTMTAPGRGGGGGGEGFVATESDDESGLVNPIQTVKGKTFILQNGVWTDTTFAPDTMQTQKIVFLSDEYFNLLTTMPELSDYFALGDRVIVVVEGAAYEVVTE